MNSTTLDPKVDASEPPEAFRRFFGGYFSIDEYDLRPKCRYEAYGPGRCRYGESCLYSHAKVLSPDEIWARDAAETRVRIAWLGDVGEAWLAMKEEKAEMWKKKQAERERQAAAVCAERMAYGHEGPPGYFESISQQKERSARNKMRREYYNVAMASLPQQK